MLPALAAVMITPFAAKAETVSQKAASQMAHAFFNHAAGQVMAEPKMVYNGRKLTTDHLFVPFYVYNNPAGGFVIISAENKAYPILGYSLKDKFDPEHIGSAEKALLSEYARDIEYIRYDSRVPEDAIAAWGNYPEYIDSILKAPADITDPAFPMEEAREALSNLESSDRIDEMSSDIYTPAQWSVMIDEELRDNRSVVLGIIDGESLLPAIIHGRKGDYYRMELDGRNQWLMRLMATELLSYGQVAQIGNPLPMPSEEEEEVPFEFYDSFMTETAAEAEARTAALDEILHPSEPVLKAIGAGRFEIDFPENVVIARVYNLDGKMVNQYTYRDTQTGHIDISGNPNGFYFALFYGENGKPYGLKLFR